MDGKKEAKNRLRHVVDELLHAGLSETEILGEVRDLLSAPVPSCDAVPVTIFANKPLGALECTVTYLHDTAHLSFSQIGILTGRSNALVSTSYKAAKKKFSHPLIISHTRIHVPISIFKDRSRGVQQLLVRYLHDKHNLKFSEIAQLLARDQRTIWTAYSVGGGA